MTSFGEWIFSPSMWLEAEAGQGAVSDLLIGKLLRKDVSLLPPRNGGARLFSQDTL